MIVSAADGGTADDQRVDSHRSARLIDDACAVEITDVKIVAVNRAVGERVGRCAVGAGTHKKGIRKGQVAAILIENPRAAIPLINGDRGEISVVQAISSRADSLVGAEVEGAQNRKVSPRLCHVARAVYAVVDRTDCGVAVGKVVSAGGARLVSEIKVGCDREIAVVLIKPAQAELAKRDIAERGQGAVIEKVIALGVRSEPDSHIAAAGVRAAVLDEAGRAAIADQFGRGDGKR